MVKDMILSMIGILIGLALVPVVFVAVGNVNWSITTGETVTDLSWIAYIIGIGFALTLVGFSVKGLVKAFGK
jgi:hypothetical protein